MFPELKSVLNIENTDKTLTEFVGVLQNGSDGSFIIHHFLSYYLKSECEQPVCFVTFTQSFNHYNTICQKIGTNFTTKKDSGRLHFVEGLKLLGESIYSGCSEEADKTNFNPFFPREKENLPNLKHFYKYLMKACESMFNDTGTSPAVIIDNLSILLDIGYSAKDIILFMQNLQSFCNCMKQQGPLITLVNSDKSSEDDDAELLWKHICHSCTTEIEISGLQSGYCKDVHGEMKLMKKEHLHKRNTIKKMQFKVMDKNVALFAAGMSSAVL